MERSAWSTALNTDEATPTDGLATAALPTSVGTIRAVLIDPGLAGTLALPQRSANDVVAARQRFLAQTADPLGALGAEREMQMRQFGDGMAY